MSSLRQADRKSTRLNSSHSLPAPLPIYVLGQRFQQGKMPIAQHRLEVLRDLSVVQCIFDVIAETGRSEEHTSELQSLPTRPSSDLCARPALPAGKNAHRSAPSGGVARLERSPVHL